MLRDVFGFKHVDAGGGWLIFAHAAERRSACIRLRDRPTSPAHRHQMSFMCDDINKTIAELRAKGVTVEGEPKDEGYGITTMLHLPGGCEVMLYEPRHPIAAAIADAAKRSRPKPAAKQSRDEAERARRNG